jgi:hypothetical protein
MPLQECENRENTSNVYLSASGHHDWVFILHREMPQELRAASNIHHDTDGLMFCGWHSKGFDQAHCCHVCLGFILQLAQPLLLKCYCWVLCLFSEIWKYYLTTSMGSRCSHSPLWNCRLQMFHLCWELTHQKSFSKWIKTKCMLLPSTPFSWNLYALPALELWVWDQIQEQHIQTWSTFPRSSNTAGSFFFKIHDGLSWVSLNNVYTLFLWWDTCDLCYWL